MTAKRFEEMKIGDYFVDLRRGNYPLAYEKKSNSTAYCLINGIKGHLRREDECVPPEVFSYGAPVAKINP